MGGGGCVWAKEQWLPVTTEHVCVCSQIREGRTHTGQGEREREKNSGGGAPVAAAVFRVQTMQDNWNVPIGRQGLGGCVLAVAHFLCLILKEKE